MITAADTFEHLWLTLTKKKKKKKRKEKCRAGIYMVSAIKMVVYFMTKGITCATNLVSYGKTNKVYDKSVRQKWS